MLTPTPATGGPPRVFPLTGVQGLHSGGWARAARWLRPRLVLEAGELRLVRAYLPAYLRRLRAQQVWLAQPLLSRRGRPGVVLSFVDGPPVFLFLGGTPRETVLTELAAAGFRVDGVEQVVSRRWQRFRPRQSASGALR